MGCLGTQKPETFTSKTNKFVMGRADITKERKAKEVGLLGAIGRGKIILGHQVGQLMGM